MDFNPTHLFAGWLLFYKSGKSIIGTIAIRGWRPILGWTGVLFLAAILGAIAVAYWRAALHGLSVPDMTGGAVPIIVSILPLCGQLFARHREMMQERAPWPSPAAVNMHGGPGDPS